MATGAAAKAAKKAQLKAEAESPKVTKKPTQAQRLSSLEDKIEMLTNLLALQMQGEQGTSVDAVSIEELPLPTLIESSCVYSLNRVKRVYTLTSQCQTSKSFSHGQDHAPSADC